MGYDNAETLGWLVHEKGIEPHVPVLDKSQRENQTFSRADFTFDHHNDRYICPGGKELLPSRRQFQTIRPQVKDDETVRYRSAKSDCDQCALKYRCCPRTPTRAVTRSIHEGARDMARAIAETDAFVASRRARRKVEMLFAQGMLVVETIAKIRRAYFGQGKSIRQICRELRVSRNTVRKVIRSGATEFTYDRTTQPRPKIGPWQSELDEMLAENARWPKRERLTLIRMYEELRNRGYGGGYDAVRRYAASWSKATQEASASAYVPLSFDPGEAYQFDWSHEIVILDGATVTVKVAHVRLCHSRMPFVRAYPRETQEMVFDAHDKAFAFFGGACARGIYDNMKTAVDAIFIGRDRAYNRRFQQMCGHYLVEPVACTPASGWEKGQVENQVGVLRRRFFVPRPKFNSFAELNAWLEDRCIAYAKANMHPDIPDMTVWEVFEAERSSLIPYVGPFDGFHACPSSEFSGEHGPFRNGGSGSVSV